MKTCRGCGEERPLQEFRKGHSRCKTCTAKARREYRLANLEREREMERRWYAANSAARIAYARQYREANRDEINSRRREWYDTNRDSEVERNRQRYREDPERRREAARKWYAENLELARQRSLHRYRENPDGWHEAKRQWARENRELVAEYDKRYRQQHPEVGRRAAQKRRLRELGIEVTQGELDYIEILRGDPCAYCGDVAGTIDHIAPLSSGPDGRWNNLTASCRSCNSSKSTATLLTFLATRA